MKHSISMVVIGAVIGALSNAAAWTDRVQFGPSAGIGFPQIPLSRFRTPISVLAAGTLQIRPFGRYFLKTDATVLTSFKTGTINGRNGNLKYNLQYATAAAGLDLMKRRNEYAILFLGAGRYRVDKQIDLTVEDREETGLNLGIEFLNRRTSLDAFYALNWHMLLESGSNPQLLTLTFGILF